MTRAVYVIGGPGTGKSTLIRDLIARLRLEYGEPVDVHAKRNVRNLVKLRGTPLLNSRGEIDGLYLGILRGVTSGTDALDKACPPTALEWAQSEPLPARILSEGMRLCFNDFLLALDARSSLLVLHLKADADELVRRFAERGTTQSEQFVRNGQTRSRRVAEAVRDAGARVVEYDTTRWPEDPETYEMVLDTLEAWVR